MKIRVVNVKTSETDAEVEVEAGDTLSLLKQKISEATGEPENDISLRFAGKNLSGNMDKTVGDVLKGADYVQANFKSTMNINNMGGGRRRSRRGSRRERKSRRNTRRYMRKNRKNTRRNRRNNYNY